MVPNGYLNNAFNRFVNLDNIEWNIVNHLLHSESKYAEYLWKILKYDTEDCLSKPNLTIDQKKDLIYTNNGDASIKRVFLSPYIDDAWVVQSSHLHIYVGPIIPKNHITSTVNIMVETITHNKISNIYGDADFANLDTNPSEIDSNGEPTVPLKSRASVMLKCMLAELNGLFVNGVGVLQVNTELSPYCGVKEYVWNNRKFYGHRTVFATLLSGESVDSRCGY